MLYDKQEFIEIGLSIVNLAIIGTFYLDLPRQGDEGEKL